MAAYERAVALDSNFALALWRLGRVMGWQRTGGESLEVVLAVRAGSSNRGLAPRDSLLVAIDSVFQAGIPGTWAWYRRLRATAREAVRRYPDDADAWYTLGEVDLHGGWGGVWARARSSPRSSARSASIRRTHRPTSMHSNWPPGSTGRRGQAVRRGVSRRARGGVTDEGIRLAFDLADPVRREPPKCGGGSSAPRPTCSTRPGSRWPARWIRGRSRCGWGGRSPPAATPLAGGPRSRPPGRLVPHPHLPRAPGRGGTHLECDNHHAGGGARRAWFIPRGASRRGRSSARQLAARRPARRRAGRLTRVVRPRRHGRSRPRRLAGGFRRPIGADSAARERGIYGGAAARAYLALARRDTADALRKFETLPDSLCGGCYLDALTRLLLLAARREDRKVLAASGWEADPPAGGEVVARLERARAAERLGERRAAIRAYQFVADAWRHADPELQPYVTEARGALERLTQEQ